MLTLYSLGTYLLFLFGPLPWPTQNLTATTLFLAATWMALLLGVAVAFRLQLATPQTTKQFRLERLIVLGFVLNLVTLPIAIYGYTGQLIQHINFDIASQGDVYSERYQFLISGGGGVFRAAAALSRTLVAPFVFGAMILGFRAWSSLSMRGRLLLLGSVGCQIVFSFSRGTDKEIADIAIFALVAWMYSTRTSRFPVRRAVLLLLALGLALTLFGLRREARTGRVDAFCVKQDTVCADIYDSELHPLVGDRFYAATVSTTNYTTQGYQGLSMALGLDFKPMYGWGHAPALRRVYGAAAGDATLADRSYQSRLTDAGWDERFSWSTLYPYLANDVSFYGVPFVMLLIGVAMGLAHRRGTTNPAAYIVFTLLFLLLIYAPANNQIAVSMESYVTFISWAAVWFATRGTSWQFDNIEPSPDRTTATDSATSPDPATSTAGENPTLPLTEEFNREPVPAA